MIALSELHARRSALAEETASNEDAIARHPETIAAVFGDFVKHTGCAALITQVVDVRQWQGNVELHRKADAEGHGYEFSIVGDETRYWMRHASGYCVELNDCGEYGKTDGPDLDMGMLQSEMPDLDTSTLINNFDPRILDWICTLPTYLAVGHLLRCVMGW